MSVAISKLVGHADHRYHRDHSRSKALERISRQAAISKVGDHADHRYHRDHSTSKTLERFFPRASKVTQITGIKESTALGRFFLRAAISKVGGHADHRECRDHSRSKALKKIFPGAAIS